MKEILIHVKINDNEISSAIRTKGFDDENVLPNTFEIIGILENLKQVEINKLNQGLEDE